MSDTREMTDELLDMAGVARKLGVTRQEIWQRYRVRKRPGAKIMPEPDAIVGTKPLWKPETIDRWQEAQA